MSQGHEANGDGEKATKKGGEKRKIKPTRDDLTLKREKIRGEIKGGRKP